jgi:cytochrome P450
MRGACSSDFPDLTHFLVYTSATFSVFILAMVLYPDVMRKAQHEIDVVVGSGRLPMFANTPNLPYVQAIVMEVLRWRPVGPLG